MTQQAKPKLEPETRLCFVIGPIGDEGSETRRRSDQLLRHIITPGANECGYEKIIRADQISAPGVITSQIIQHLMDAPLVVADLTDQNPNVFYELAIRHVVKKPIVQLIQAEQRIPFDVLQMRTIPFDLHDPDRIEECTKKLVQQIRAVEKNPSDADNPISAAVELQALRQSDNPFLRSHGEILSRLQGLDLVGAAVDFLIEQVDELATKINLVVERTEPKQVPLRFSKVSVGPVLPRLSPPPVARPKTETSPPPVARPKTEDSEKP